VLAATDPPLWLVTAAAEGRRGGCIATFAMGASIVPRMPRVMLGLATHHHTWQLVEASDAFCLHLLGEADAELVWRFGGATGHDRDKLAGFDTTRGETGAPRLDAGLGWLDCRVEARLGSGDRTIYLAAVVDGACRADGTPLRASRLAALLSEAKRAALDEMLARDQATDAAAIAAWRISQGR
jgi:flavin reductase (DIM6/NTAB) family NADH-FMN oxidoreductase RutF